MPSAMRGTLSHARHGQGMDRHAGRPAKVIKAEGRSLRRCSATRTTWLDVAGPRDVTQGFKHLQRSSQERRLTLIITARGSN